MFNVPSVVVATIAALCLVHAGRALLLSPVDDYRFLLEFAFIPARYDASPLLGGPLPGGWGAEIWTFFTYALIHADIMHLGVNIVWFLPFGAAVARRFGPIRFLAFFAVTAAAGALAHLVSYPGEMVPVIGASAAISGFMAAALRFAFQRGGPLTMWRENDPESYRVPAEPLSVALRDTRVLVFLVAWFGLNFLFGLGSVAIPGASGAIAWQAHVGGFLAGLVLFAVFDPIAPAPKGNGNIEPDSAGSDDAGIDAR
jgi:membrane associated rhomboid family serine protease